MDTRPRLPRQISTARILEQYPPLLLCTCLHSALYVVGWWWRRGALVTHPIGVPKAGGPAPAADPPIAPSPWCAELQQVGGWWQSTTRRLYPTRHIRSTRLVAGAHVFEAAEIQIRQQILDPCLLLASGLRDYEIKLDRRISAARESLLLFLFGN